MLWFIIVLLVVGLLAGALARLLVPGPDPMSLPAPEELCPLILEMLSPDYAATGEVVRFSR